MNSIYPNGFYRVSLKAIIRDADNRVLVVKEQSDSWSLPGGGLDHNESVQGALKRELYEEARITAPFTFEAVGIHPLWLELKSVWLLWVVFNVKLDGAFDFGVGQDATEVAFVDPTSFKHSTSRTERLVYKWCVASDMYVE